MPVPRVVTAEAIAERKRKRAERRDLQRATNITRAEKMHVARIAWEKSPSIDHAEEKSKTTKAKKPHIHIGCSGWYYWHWKGGFYPADLPSNKWFAHYMGDFATVELNAPFYGWPTVATVRGWLRQVQQRPFIYTIKVSELITHIKRFTGTKRLIKDFGLIADILGPHMGCFLFQLPPSFHFSPARLKAIVTQLDPARRNAVEFRHASWWNEDVYAAFQKAGIIFCSCSGPKLPDQLIKTADDIYVRFHGTGQWYRHDYSHEELMQWGKRIKANKAQNIWIYFNNDRDGYAIKNAKELAKILLGK